MWLSNFNSLSRTTPRRQVFSVVLMSISANLKFSLSSLLPSTRWWVTDRREHSLTIFLCYFTASLPSFCFIFFHSSFFWDECFFAKGYILLCFSFWASALIKVWSMLLCNSAIIPKHFSLKRCPHSCPLMIFPDFLVNRWAFSFWILLFSFSDFSFKSWSFLILWLIAWQSVGLKGSSFELWLKW